MNSFHVCIRIHPSWICTYMCTFLHWASEQRTRTLLQACKRKCYRVLDGRLEPLIAAL